MAYLIRPWNPSTDQAFFDHCQIESFKSTLADADTLSEEEIQQKYEEFDKNDPIDMSRPGHAVFIMETSQGQSVGLVWISHREPFWRFKSPLTWIYNLYVIPTFRRQKIATALLKVAERWTQKESLSLIGLHVLERNRAARALYESCGYRLAATHNESYFYEKPVG
jgi:ribosomal protein S18 acetylase RimI-like enzyme